MPTTEALRQQLLEQAAADTTVPREEMRPGG
jgi:hypothetical protein